MAEDGFVIVDKPGGMTSHDVVARVRRLARTRRVGHGGTLDPMATGVLVVGIERATRLLPYAAGHTKAYRGTIRLGQTTVTDDAEGEVTATTDAGHLAEAEISAALAEFRGEITQVPSAVSAVKVKGVRSYVRVRRGEDVALAPRPVTIHRLDLLSVRRNRAADPHDPASDPATAPTGPVTIDVEIDMECSAGTYVRALARDLGAALGVGGHLVALRRTAVGDFTLAEAVTLADLAAEPNLPRLTLPQVAERLFARRDVDAAAARTLSHGGPIPACGQPGPYAVFGPGGRVIAIVAEHDGLARAQVVLAAPMGRTAEPMGTTTAESRGPATLEPMGKTTAEVE
ncbi:MAG: tRNA pseudouridine(55) synthase TruB [Micromonosporaceae bacterium]|nr:tRNA pseudouridine(55) synthase TruB [Micromonosporaceae bacterium]